MASQGPNVGQLGSTGSGDILWALAKGVASAIGFDHADVSNYLVASNFGFAIPSTATVEGISVSIRRRASDGIGPHNIRDLAVQLSLNGSSPTGSNLASTSSWPTAYAFKSYGGSGNLWGLTPTYSQVNSSSFSVFLSVFATASVEPPVPLDAFVSEIDVEITYTDAGGTYTATATLSLPALDFAASGDTDTALFSAAASLALPGLEMDTLSQGGTTQPNGRNLTRWLEEESFAFGGVL